MENRKENSTSPKAGGVEKVKGNYKNPITNKWENLPPIHVMMEYLQNEIKSNKLIIDPNRFQKNAAEKAALKEAKAKSKVPNQQAKNDIIAVITKNAHNLKWGSARLTLL